MHHPSLMHNTPGAHLLPQIRTSASRLPSRVSLATAPLSQIAVSGAAGAQRSYELSAGISMTLAPTRLMVGGEGGGDTAGWLADVARLALEARLVAMAGRPHCWLVVQVGLPAGRAAMPAAQQCSQGSVCASEISRPARCSSPPVPGSTQ